MLRIGCDLDGTLANMRAALQREAESLFGFDVDLHAEFGAPDEPPTDDEVAQAEETNGDRARDADRQSASSPKSQIPKPKSQVQSPKRRGLTSREYRLLWQHCQGLNNFWCSLPEVEAGAVARFGDASHRHAWEIIFLTQRPASAGELAQVQTQRWLEVHGFELPSVFVVNGSRGKIADALQLDAVIDDRPENCLDVVTESKAKAFLVWRDDPRLVPPGAARMGIETVFSFAEALQRLEALPFKPTSSQRLIGRVRQTRGI